MIDELGEVSVPAPEEAFSGEKPQEPVEPKKQESPKTESKMDAPVYSKDVPEAGSLAPWEVVVKQKLRESQKNGDPRDINRIGESVARQVFIWQEALHASVYKQLQNLGLIGKPPYTSAMIDLAISKAERQVAQQLGDGEDIAGALEGFYKELGVAEQAVINILKELEQMSPASAKVLEQAVGDIQKRPAIKTLLGELKRAVVQAGRKALPEKEKLVRVGAAAATFAALQLSPSILKALDLSGLHPQPVYAASEGEGGIKLNELESYLEELGHKAPKEQKQEPQREKEPASLAEEDTEFLTEGVKEESGELGKYWAKDQDKKVVENIESGGIIREGEAVINISAEEEERFIESGYTVHRFDAWLRDIKANTNIDPALKEKLLTLNAFTREGDKVLVIYEQPVIEKLDENLGYNRRENSCSGAVLTSIIEPDYLPKGDPYKLFEQVDLSAIDNLDVGEAYNLSGVAQDGKAFDYHTSIQMEEFKAQTPKGFAERLDEFLKEGRKPIVTFIGYEGTAHKLRVLRILRFRDEIGNLQLFALGVEGTEGEAAYWPKLEGLGFLRLGNLLAFPIKEASLQIVVNGQSGFEQIPVGN